MNYLTTNRSMNRMLDSLPGRLSFIYICVNEDKNLHHILNSILVFLVPILLIQICVIALRHRAKMCCFPTCGWDVSNNHIMRTLYY